MPNAGPALATSEGPPAPTAGVVAPAVAPEKTTPAAGTIVTPPVRIEAKPAPRADHSLHTTVEDPFRQAVVERPVAPQPSIVEIHIANIEIRAAPPPATVAAPPPVGPSLDAFLQRRREQ